MNEKFLKAYQNLNPEQQQAVDAIEGPVLVLAGPGTGKTQILSMRIANILLKTDSPADSILALTFTESGVRAMKERLLSIIGLDAYKVNIYTFHSFCSDIIQANPEEFLSRSGMQPLSDLERVSIFKSLIDNEILHSLKPFNAPYFYLQTISTKIKELKREGVSPMEYLKLVNLTPELQNIKPEIAKEKSKNLELQRIYKKYQDKLKELGKYDFEDMISLVLDKFTEDVEFLRKYQERFLYTLVDEFQDTNNSQAKLLYKLNEYWGENANLFVVGDDNQSIYRFQGASTQNVLDFLNRFENAKKIDLVMNYRSYQHIIDASYHIIKNNKLAVEKENKLISYKSSLSDSGNSQALLEYSKFNNNYLENYFLVKKIQELLNTGVHASEIAIIYRNNFDSIDISDLLSRFNINYIIEGGSNILDSGIIIRFLHLLKVIDKISTGTEDLELFTLLSYEFSGINQSDVVKLSRFATKKKINLLESLESKDLDRSIFNNFEKIDNFVKLLIELNKSENNLTFIDFIDLVLERSGFLAWLLKEPNYFELLNKLNSLLSEIKKLSMSDKSLNLKKFLGFIDVMTENNITITEETLELQENKIRLMTAHKSKGLEFDYVFIPKFIEKKWSNTISRNLIKLPRIIVESTETIDEKELKIEEERRLFFVALTRAKKGIFITCAASYNTGSTKENLESMFLHEFPLEMLGNVDTNLTNDFDENFSILFKPKAEKNYSDDEIAYLKSILSDFKLSASSLNTYIECAYKFKLDFVLNTPKVTEKPLALGSAIHKALEISANRLRIKAPVSLEFLLEEYEKALKKEILTSKDFKEILSEGQSILKVYYETYKDEFLMQNGKNIGENILFVEKFFGYGFYKPILENIPLSGRIDRIEITDREQKLAKVRDYKSGKPKSRSEILGKTAYSTGAEYRQLLFYKLLTDLDQTLKFKVTEVELDFIGNRNTEPKRECFYIDEKDLAVLKSTIKDVYAGIMRASFERTKNYSICKMCRYKFHCWPDGIPSTNSEQMSLL